jgi:large repetitive protein
MGDCLRRFEAALGAGLALAMGACSPQTLVAVDPSVDPCAVGAGDAAGCIPPGLLDDLVGYWRLDDGPGSSTVRDSSGRGNNGALIGVSAGSAWVQGWSGTGIDFGGTGWVVVPASASIDAITDRVTVAAWVYLEGTVVNWGTAESRQIRGGIEQHYHLSLNGDNRPNLFITTANVTQLLTAPDAVAPRTWVHLAGTYDGAYARLYVNGVLALSPVATTGSFRPDTTPLILGGNDNDATGVPTELFPGKLDEIMLYRRALTGEEIGRLVAGALLSSTTPGGDAGAD